METYLYRHYDDNKDLLYVGVSLSAVHRLGQHADHSEWFKLISYQTIERYETRELALKAEREAIIKENPKHNKIHKKEAEKYKRKEQEKIINLAQTKKDLTARIVNLNPVYSAQEAAQVLNIQTHLLNKWIKEDKIGYFFMPTKFGKPKIYISGWQLIEFLENQINSTYTNKTK